MIWQMFVYKNLRGGETEAGQKLLSEIFRAPGPTAKSENPDAPRAPPRPPRKFQPSATNRKLDIGGLGVWSLPIGKLRPPAPPRTLPEKIDHKYHGTTVRDNEEVATWKHRRQSPTGGSPPCSRASSSPRRSCPKRVRSRSAPTSPAASVRFSPRSGARGGATPAACTGDRSVSP